ncbi:MAG: SURF1 family protein [Gammaproteobacteria bacterium]|nr:SURF1 family protein [Gammaproteobacteria bacterium]
MSLPQFRPGWKLTAFTLVFTPLLLWLGFWQLDREQEKVALQADFENRGQRPAIPLESVDWSRPDESAYLKISATGVYDNERSYLLDNRVYQGHVGYELISPFTTQSDMTVLVNRGWIAQGATRAELPQITRVEGQVAITATIYVPLEEPFLLSSTPEGGQATWPRVIQSIQVSQMEQELDQTLAPYTIRPQEKSPGLEQSNWQTVNMLPEKHRAYAVQWFAMTFALLAMYAFFGFRHPVNNTTLQRRTES